MEAGRFPLHHKYFGGLIVRRITLALGIRASERTLFAVTALYVVALVGFCVYFSYGTITQVKLGVAALALPAVCIGALMLMIEWGRLDSRS